MAGVRAILDKYDVRPRKQLGQNFLVNDGYLGAVARAAKLTGDDVALEIGAGIGNLTKLLAAKAGKVLAIEFDRDMLRVLRGELDEPNVEILEADALKVDYRTLCPDEKSSGAASGAPTTGKKMVAVANLPYNIATEIVFRLIDARQSFKRLLLMTQLEVARRFAAKVGTKEYGVLAVSCGLWAKMKIEMTVPAGAFYPRPKVDSAVVRFDIGEKPAAEVSSFERYRKIVRASFAHRRKMLMNSLSSAPSLGLDKATVITWLEKAGIDPHIRAQKLSVEDFALLERQFPHDRQ